MLNLDISEFFIGLMQHLARRENIPWSPIVIYQPLLRIYTLENEDLLDSVGVVGRALGFISAIEIPFHVDEFELLMPNLGYSLSDFRSFFSGCISESFLSNYSAFNFLRYLSYIISFSLFCYRNGYILAPDFAILAVMAVIQRRPKIFRHLWTLTQLVTEARRINSPDFEHPVFIRPDSPH